MLAEALHELADDLGSFVVVRQMLRAGLVAEIDGDVPLERRRSVGCSELGLLDGFDQTFAAPVAAVAADMSIAESPQAKGIRGSLGRCASGRNSKSGSEGGFEKTAACRH